MLSANTDGIACLSSEEIISHTLELNCGIHVDKRYELRAKRINVTSYDLTHLPLMSLELNTEV
jgi:hypothetical protein